MRLGRLTDSGIDEFASWLGEARKQPDCNPPHHLLLDPKHSEAVPGGSMVTCPLAATWQQESDVAWIRKGRVARELDSVLARVRSPSIMTDVGLWSWLALSWFDILTLQPDGRRKIQNRDYYYILDLPRKGDGTARRRYDYRHLLRTPYRVHKELGQDAMFMLGADIQQHGEAIEQLLGRLEILRIPAVAGAINRLYFDPASRGGLKRGAMTAARQQKDGTKHPTPGGLRDRFPVVIRRLQRNFDLYSIDPDRLIELLGREFQAWGERATRNVTTRARPELTTQPEPGS